MRFSTTTLLALPLLAAAAQVETPLEQAQAQLKSWGAYLSSFIPATNAPHTPDAAAAKVGSKVVNVLRLDNWEETLRSKSKGPEAEQWYIFFTGGNKTCFGHCGGIEKAWNETAAIWSVDPTAPHLGYVNCDNQPVLCNSWAAGPPSLWVLDVRPKPAKSDLYHFSFNVTTTSTQDFLDIRTTEAYKTKEPYVGYFHPLDGQLKELGVATAVGYFFWVFNVVPNWLFMLVISFASRSFMGNRANPGAPAARR